jgi:molybdopterin/thiamine biosynthesis adenylyltransferase
VTVDAGDNSRHHRTLAYTHGVQPLVPAGLTAGALTASTAVGQAAILTAVNILARVHPEVVLAIPDAPLVVPSPIGGDTLLDACRALATAANPEIVVTIANEIPANVLSVGIGADAGPATMYAGGACWTAMTRSTPVEIAPEPSSLLGVGMAVALATGIVFRAALGLPTVRDRSVSLWTLAEADEPTGPTDCGPVNVGNVWMVGAGAVGSCLAWWLQFTGVVGNWAVIDGGITDGTNLNRSLGLFAADAGLTGKECVAKAIAAANLIPGAVPFTQWWSEWCASNPASPDVLIPVANDFGVRANIAAYSHPATIHATTSRDWTAELHRHQIGQDDCLACRFPEDTPAFLCASAPIQNGAEHHEEAELGKDAALPFLSAAAGMLLLAGLFQLQHGQWTTHRQNHWRVFFDVAHAAMRSSRWQCRHGCTATASPNVRRVSHGQTRWRQLDATGAGSA